MSSFDLIIPCEVHNIVQALAKINKRVWIVGGALRDHLMQSVVTNWDLATDATPEDMLRALPNLRDIGRDYGVMGYVSKDDAIGMIEIATLRKEGLYKDHRRPHKVIFCERIEDDLARRDFTCNAMAYQVDAKQWLDPFDGTKACEEKQLITVGDPEVRFEEDALRILRGYRMMATRGFSMDTSTHQAAKKMSHHLQWISRERIVSEMQGLLSGVYVDNVWKVVVQDLDASVWQFPPSTTFSFSMHDVPDVFWLRLASLWIKNHPIEAQDTTTWIQWGMPKKQAKWMASLFQILSLERDETWHKPLLDLWIAVDHNEALIEALDVWQMHTYAKHLRGFQKAHPSFVWPQLPLSTKEIQSMAGGPKGKDLGDLLDALYTWVAQDPKRIYRQKLKEQIEYWARTRYSHDS